MRLKLEQLESRTLLTVDVQVLHDPIVAAQPGDEVTRTIRVFSESFDGELQVSSSLSKELENVRWERMDGFAKQELPNPYLDQEPDFQIAAGRTEFALASIHTTGDPLGDLNGDGAQDFLFFNATSRLLNDGAIRDAVVVFGPLESDLDLGELAADGSEGFKLDGEHNPFKPLGDLNGDGFDDIAQGNKIIFGALDLNAQSPALTITDAQQLEPTGDINGDGFNDLLAVGSDGFAAFDRRDASYLIFGRERFADQTTASADSLASAPNSVLILGESVSTASPAGDLNNDGLDDVVFGRLNPNRELLPFVLYGDIDFPTNVVNFDGLDGTAGFAIGNPLDVDVSDPEPTEDWAWRISGTSDVNGDAVDDLVIAYSGNGHCIISCGDRDVDAGVFVLHGGANIASSGEFRPELDSHSTIRLATPYADPRLNAHVADMNSDGLADIHITSGAHMNRNFVFFGDMSPSNLDLGHSFYPYEGFNGEDGYQHTGDLRFFDVNGDGIEDALLQVHVDQPNRDSGPDHRVDVFLGKSFEPTVFRGTGDINEILELDDTSSVIYKVTGTLKEDADSITTVAMPVDQVDVDLHNNLASDRTGVLLSVHSSEPVINSSDVELLVTVTNEGPSNATDVRFSESITSSLEDVTWTKSTQLFPASISLLELPIGLGASLEAPEIVRFNERCSCATDGLNQYLGRPVH